MSWFNPKAFAAGALSELNEIIDTNFDEAKAYEEEQRELFKTSKIEIGRRRGIVGGLVSVARKLGDMGVSKAAIQAAHSSGPQGLLTLQKLITEENKRRVGLGGKLSGDEINAMISMGGLTAAQNPEFEKMDYQTFFEKSMNLGDSGTPEAAPQRNFIQEALGFGDKKAVRAKLDAEMGGGKLSILDINEAAQRDAYNSLMPGSYATFTPTPFYESSKAIKQYATLANILETQLANAKKHEGYRKIQSSNLPQSEIDKLKLAYKQNEMIDFVATQVQKFGKDAVNDKILDYESIVGTNNFNKILLEYGLFEGSSVSNTINTDLALKGDIVTIPMGGDLQAIVTMGPNGPLSVQTVNKSNPNIGNIERDPTEITTFIEGLIKRNLVSENIMQQGELDAEVYYNTLQSTTDAAFTDPRTGEVLGAEYLNPDVLESAQDFRESDQVFTGQTAGLMSPQELSTMTGSEEEQANQLAINEYNKSLEEFKDVDLSQKGSKGVLISDMNEARTTPPPKNLNSQTADELTVDIVSMASTNEVHAKLVEEFFGPNASKPTAATFREFQNSLKTSMIGGDADSTERDALSEKVTLLENEILRDGKAAKSVWSYVTDGFSWMLNNAASEKSKKEAKEK